jgi:hypothetical protein
MGAAALPSQRTATAVFLVYVRAYAHYYFRSAPWVTGMCLILFMVLLFVPQASELILSQATLPSGSGDAFVYWLRFSVLNAASFVVAICVWASARLLVSTEWRVLRGESSFGAALAAYESDRRALIAGQPPLLSVEDRADIQASVFAPRQLGLSVFLIVQLAAAQSISEQGFYVPIALVSVWLVVLVLQLMRLSDIQGEDLRPWWWGLLALATAYAGWALVQDLDWLGERRVDPVWLAGQYLSVWKIMGAAVGSCALLALLTLWVTAPGAPRRRQTGVTIVVFAVVAGTFEWAIDSREGDMYPLLFIAESALATAYWMAVVFRRKYVSGRVTSVLMRFVAILAFMLVLWAIFDPIGMGRSLGAIGIVLFFFACLVFGVSMAQAWISRSSWHLASPTGLVALGMLFLFFAVGTRPQPPPLEGQFAAPTKALERELPALVAGREPAFAVAAHGGGIRAALYTASFAAWMDHYTNSDFSSRLVVASGASGGSVGLAVWSAVRAAGCDKVAVKRKEIPACVQAVHDTLAQDHLAPLIATGLFRDYFLPGVAPERGNTLQASVLHAAQNLSPRIVIPAEMRLMSRLPHAPLPLLLNATQVGTAVPYAIATRPGMLTEKSVTPEQYATYVQSTDSDAISVLTAAMHSARFPLISPKGMVSSNGPTVVDGGYFDNSGVAVLRQYILGLRHRSGSPYERLLEKLVVVSIDNEPIGSRAPPAPGAPINSIQEIIGTILAARGAHGRAAWHQLCRELNLHNMHSVKPGAPLWGGCDWPTETTSDDGPQFWQVQRQAQGPALGWYLSPRSARRVAEDARHKAWAIALQYGYGIDHDPPEGSAIKPLSVSLPMP